MTPRCAVCFEEAEGEIRIRRLIRSTTIVLRLCAVHTRRAFRVLSEGIAADLNSQGDWAQRRRDMNPYFYRTLTLLKQQLAEETDPERRQCLERALAEQEAAVAAQEAESSVDFLLWEME